MEQKKRCSTAVFVTIGCVFAVLAGISAAGAADTSPYVSKDAATMKAAIPAKSSMDALTAIFTRRSIRSYASKPVSDQTVKILLQAAMAAPSARNEQSWEFIVIRDKKTLAEIPSFHPFAKHIPTAPVAIVICGNTKLEAKPGLWIPDCSNAAMNILLAAHSLGLGGVWTTFYPYEDRMAGARKLFKLPDHIVPLNIIPIGYPVEKTFYQDRFKAEKVHYEKW